jgi:alkylation response protein AidB-like acyl-CoA dehydrogenase
VKTLLTGAQAGRYAEFQAFAAASVAPFAAAWDRDQQIPPAAVRQLGAAGYLGALLPAEYGGQGWDVVTFGLLNEALGRADSAYTGIVTVQSMIAMPLLKWGTPQQRDRWLRPLARGEVMGAIALTEPAGGSDLSALTTEIRRSADGSQVIVSGEKRWVTSSQMAGIFLVFGQCGGQSAACLVPRDTPGFEIEPIRDLMGFRAAGLAKLTFRDVVLPAENLVGKPGFAVSHVAPEGLHFGRISTACSALGLLRGCLEESAGHAARRQVGQHALRDLGMIQTLLARMGADWEAAQLLCWSACRAQDERRPEKFRQAFAAKYFASQAAVRAAGDAVQIFGAAGVHESNPVARFFRNCKIMEIIEGTSQIHERVLSQEYVQDAVARQRRQ